MAENSKSSGGSRGGKQNERKDNSGHVQKTSSRKGTSQNEKSEGNSKGGSNSGSGRGKGKAEGEE